MAGDLAAPFKCPLSNCEENLSSSLLLSHFLKIHQREENSVDFKEIKEKENISLMVSVTDDYLELEQNVCLGVLAYKARHVKHHSNVLLSHDYEQFKTHLPILIMACRGNYIKLFESEAEFIDPEADFLILWLVMPETSSKQKLSATITVHNEEMTKSISKLISIRNADLTQSARLMIQEETDFLIVYSAFVNDIADSGSILVETSVSENLM